MAIWNQIRGFLEIIECVEIRSELCEEYHDASYPTDAAYLSKYVPSLS